MNNFNVVVIGAGQMGAGIAALCVLKDFPVTLIDFSSESLTKAKVYIQQQLERKSSPVNKIDQLLSFDTEVKSLEDISLVIEAIPEIFALKKELYLTLNDRLTSRTILATNTSSFSIAQLSEYVPFRENFLGIHFMNPVLKMELVELIPSRYTGAGTLNTSKEFVAKLSKVSVVAEDTPGFIVNKLLIPLINHAFQLLESNTLLKTDIDVALEKGAGFPMGPLKLADFIGLDTCLSIMETLNHEYPLDGYAPSNVLINYVKQGKLGRKTKQGVYDY